MGIKGESRGAVKLRPGVAKMAAKYLYISHDIMNQNQNYFQMHIAIAAKHGTDAFLKMCWRRPKK